MVVNLKERLRLLGRVRNTKKIGVMNHPARNPLEEIEWIGKNGFDFVDFTLEVFAPQKEYLLLSRDLLRQWWVRA